MWSCLSPIHRPFPPYRQREVLADQQTAKTVNKGHGRIESRELTTATLGVEQINWPGVKQVCRIVRTRTAAGVTSRQVAYAITSVDRDHGDAQTLLRWWRGHWGIENRLHWIRDETFGEDRCRVRRGNAGQVLAGVRNIAINWLRSRKVTQIAAELRQNSWNPQRLFAMLGKQNL